MGVATVADLVSAIVEGPYGMTGLSKAEMLRVWAAIGQHIEEQMATGKGVNVPDLGLFSFTSQKLDLGNRYKVTSTPAFFLSERFSRTHGVRNKKPSPVGTIPVVELNFSSIGQQCGASRDVVKAVLKDVLVAVADYVHMKKGCELEMGVGRLVFRGGTAILRWKASFVSQIEASNTVITETSRPLTAPQAVNRELIRDRPRTAYAPRASTGNASMDNPRPPSRPRPSTAGVMNRTLPSDSGTRQFNGIQGTSIDPAARPPVAPLSSVDQQADALQRLQLQPTTRSTARSSRPSTAPSGLRAFYDTDSHDGPTPRYNAREDYEAALQTRVYLRQRERTLDKQLKDMLDKDAAEKFEEEKREVAERRAKERDIATYNQRLTADKKQRQVMLAEAALQTAEDPVLGKRPVTPPPTVRAFEYQKLLEEQINFKDARKRQAIAEEMAYASVTQTLLDKELEEAEQRLERETLAKRQEHAEILARQIRQQALKREEEELDDDQWEPTIKIREEPSADEKRAKARKIHEDHMQLITQRRQAAEAMRQADSLHEQRELEKLREEQLAETRAARLRQFQTRRMLEDSWADQITTKHDLTVAEPVFGPTATSLNLKRQPRRTNGQKRVLKRRYRLGNQQL